MLKETLEIFAKTPREKLINLVSVPNMNVILYAIDENNKISKYGEPFKIVNPKPKKGETNTPEEIDDMIRQQVPFNLYLLKSMLYDSQWVLHKKCISEKLNNISYLSYLVTPKTKIIKDIYKGKIAATESKMGVSIEAFENKMSTEIKKLNEKFKNKPADNKDLLNFLLGELNSFYLFDVFENIETKLNVDMKKFEKRMGTLLEITPFNEEEVNNIVEYFKQDNNASEIYLKDAEKEQTRVFFVYTKNGKIDEEKTIRRYKEENDRYTLLVGIFNGDVTNGTCDNRANNIKEQKLYFNPTFNSLPSKKPLVGTISRPTEAPDLQTIEEMMVSYEFSKFLQIKSRYNTFYFNETKGVTVNELKKKQMYYKISREFQKKYITEMECMIPEINNEIKTIEVKDYVTGGRRLGIVKTFNKKVQEDNAKAKTSKAKKSQPITIYEPLVGTEEVIINKIRNCFWDKEKTKPLKIFSDDKEIAKKQLLENYQESMLPLYQTDNNFGAIDRTNMYLSVLNFIEEGVEEKFMNMKEILKEKLETKEDFELENAEQFGFLVGQLLKLSLNRSKSGDKHLGYIREIMKTRKVGRMKNQLIDKVFTNAQDIKFNYVKEQKALGAVLTYPDEDENLNEVFILTGFLADSLLIPAKNTDEKTDENETTDTTQEESNENQIKKDLEKVS